MSTVDDMYRDLGVVHDADCWICDLDEPTHGHPERRSSLLSRFWAKWYAPWLLAGLVLVLAYIAAIHSIYAIVGGLK